MILNRDVYFSSPIHIKTILFFKKFFYILFRFLGRPTWGRIKAGERTLLEKQDLILTVNEEGQLNCTTCGLCVQVCPTQCLAASLPPESTGPEAPAFFHFEPLKCISCNWCEDICPESAIAFIPQGRGAGHFEEDWARDIHSMAYRHDLNDGQGLTPQQVDELRGQSRKN